MKRFFTSMLALIMVMWSFAQAPQMMSYQAVIRNANNGLVVTSPIGMRISILKDSTAGQAVYVETQSAKTNSNGLVSLEIGSGTVVSGSFNLIDWANGPYFIMTETDTKGGTNYTITSVSQLLSVPYALFAGKSNTDAKLEVIDKTGLPPDSALFDVKNSKGEVVFAVYDNSAAVYVDESLAKGARGGFTVGGRTSSKGGTFSNYLSVTSDSTRITTKNPNSGFSVQDTSGNGSNYLNIKPGNMFIGKEAGQNTVGLYNSFFGHQSGLNNTTGAQNIFIGFQSGLSNNLGSANIFLGPSSGYNNTQGAYNVFIGQNSGYSNIGGNDNVFVGQRSGYENFSGEANLFAGQNSGESNFNGNHNVFLGFQSGDQNTSGVGNVYLGSQSGFSDTIGNFNVFLGNQAGFNEKGSNKLYIDNSGKDNTNALVYGDFSTGEIRMNAKVGINSDNSGYSLNVAGDINLNGQLYQNSVPYNPGLVKVQLTENLASPLPYTNPSIGLLVYNVGTLQPTGFYYWDGSRWNKLLSSTSASVSCDSITNILGTSAKMHATVTADGGSTVTSYGFCWNTTGNPNISGSHSLDGSGIGSFTSTISGLTNYTNYHVRAYAQNAAGISYSQEIQFNTGTTVTVPIITTTSVTNITGTAAASGGTITSSGGASVATRGVCWNTTGNPTIFNSKIVNGSGIGNFVSTLDSLTMGTTYHVRAFATNTVGTAYGEDVQFTTPTLPTVSTTSISSISGTSVSSGGNITSQGGAEISQRGVCWSSTNSSPTLSDSHTSDGSGAGVFSSSLTGLNQQTNYYIRAYATNAAGTSYGNTVTFTTLVVDIDGNIYHTVTIGTQVWMVENLKTTHFNDGSPIFNCTDNATWGTLTTPAFCWYNNDSTNKNPYGALYNWYAAISSNLCPPGWHLPTVDDFNTLYNYLGGASTAGGLMKEAGTAHWSPPNTGATNASGFTAVAGGSRSAGGGLWNGDLGIYSFFYANNNNYNYGWELAYNTVAAAICLNGNNYTNASLGFSVRLIHN
jgi:uncharacterized protein (TIGR02145 family)